MNISWRWSSNSAFVFVSRGRWSAEEGKHSGRDWTTQWANIMVRCSSGVFLSVLHVWVHVASIWHIYYNTYLYNLGLRMCPCYGFVALLKKAEVTTQPLCCLSVPVWFIPTLLCLSDPPVLHHVRVTMEKATWPMGGGLAALPVSTCSPPPSSRPANTRLSNELSPPPPPSLPVPREQKWAVPSTGLTVYKRLILSVL